MGNRKKSTIQLPYVRKWLGQRVDQFYIFKRGIERRDYKIRRDWSLVYANSQYAASVFQHEDGDKMKSLSVWFISSNKSVRQIKNAEDHVGWRYKWYVFTVTVTYINLHHRGPNNEFILCTEELFDKALFAEGLCPASLKSSLLCPQQIPLFVEIWSIYLSTKKCPKLN